VTDSAIEHAQIARRPARRVLIGALRELAMIPAIVVLFVAGLFTSPAFFTTANFSNTAQFSAALGLVVVAESLILLTGSLDLSLQSVYGLAPMIGAWLIVSKDAQGLGTH
jgi:simple sugar transport system permease protein